MLLLLNGYTYLQLAAAVDYVCSDLDPRPSLPESPKRVSARASRCDRHVIGHVTRLRGH